MTCCCCCPKCANIYKAKDGDPCPYCGWKGIYYRPRTVADLDKVGEDTTRERYHHKIDSQMH